MRGRRAFDLAENLFERRGRRHVEGLVENLRNVAALSIERSVGTSPSALELQRRAPVADALIVQSSDAGTAKRLVLDDHAARQITAALQRHVVTDADVAFDVRVGADHALRPMIVLSLMKTKVADVGLFADAHGLRNDAVAAENLSHLDRPR